MTEQLLSDIRTRRLTESEFDQVREYLLSVGASCTDQNSWSHESCNGLYSTEYAMEVWEGPSGHKLRFTYMGPNPVGPQQNGWGFDRSRSCCPEWIQQDIKCALRYSCAQVEQVRTEMERLREADTASERKRLAAAVLGSVSSLPSPIRSYRQKRGGFTLPVRV